MSLSFDNLGHVKYSQTSHRPRLARLLPRPLAEPVGGVHCWRGAGAARQLGLAHPSAWVNRIAETVLAQDAPVVLVAHSLGCIACTHLPAEAVARVQGALLVAPADPERRAPLVDFSPVPYQALPYRSVVVASANDPYCPVRTAGAYARSWGSEFVRLQNAGHINIDSGFGDWPLGLALLQSLVATPLVFKSSLCASSPHTLEMQSV